MSHGTSQYVKFVQMKKADFSRVYLFIKAIREGNLKTKK